MPGARFEPRSLAAIVLIPILNLTIVYARRGQPHATLIIYLTSKGVTYFLYKIGLFIYQPKALIAQWRRCLATNHKVAGSIPVKVFVFLFFTFISFFTRYIRYSK